MISRDKLKSEKNEKVNFATGKAFLTCGPAGCM
jgi:hypothetical protein